MWTTDVVTGLVDRVDVQPRPPRRFGTAGPITSLFRKVWESEHHVFAAEGGHRMPTSGQVQDLGHPDRAPRNVLNRFPVEVLVIDEGTQHTGRSDRYWTRWIETCEAATLPNYIFVAAPAQELVLEEGLQSKGWRRRFERWGYESHFWFLRNHEHGGAVRQDRCILALRRNDPKVAPLQNPEVIETEGGPRSARNLLSPVGIPRTAWCTEEWKPATAYPEWLRDAAAPCLLAGETIKRRLPVFSPDGCLPDSVGTLIETEKGVRRLQAEELSRAKGVPTEWIQQELLTVRAINQLTDLHIWSAVASSMRRVVEVETTDLSQPADMVDLHLPERPTSETSAELEDWE